MNVRIETIAWDLRFHHRVFRGMPMVEPRITVCMDSLFRATSEDICLDVDSATDEGRHESTTRTTCFHFVDTKDSPTLIQASDIPESILGEFYDPGKVPRNAKLTLWVYATHTNTDNFPSQVCVGAGSLNLFDVWETLHGGSAEVVTVSVRITNRGTIYGKLVLDVRRGDFITFADGYRWSSQTDAPTVDDEMAVAETHARHERAWLRTFKKVWGNVDNMLDLYGFMIGGRALPISYFATRERLDIGPAELSLLLDYAVRRYSAEKATTPSDVMGALHERRMSVKELCGVLCEMVTLLVASHAYMTDYVINPMTGRYKLVETFQSASRSGSGDCEDFSRQLDNLWATLCREDLDLGSHPVLQQMQHIARMYIPPVSLDRTTVPKMTITPGMLGDYIRKDVKKRFRSAHKKRMHDCQGRRMDVAAHMNVFAIPRPYFFRIVDPSLNPDFAPHVEAWEKVMADDAEDMERLVDEYRATYDPSFDPEQLQVLVLEGTGNFNAINEIDEHPVERQAVLDSFDFVAYGKHKIYHPLHDPNQFYLNPLIFITSYFMRHHRFPLTTLVCSYEPTGSGSLVYGATYVDLIQKSDDVRLVPGVPLSDTEWRCALSAARRNYRHPFCAIRTESPISSLLVGGGPVSVASLFRSFSVPDTRTVYAGTDIHDEAAFYAATLSGARSIVVDAGDGGGEEHSVPVMLSFPHVYFASDDFVSRARSEIERASMMDGRSLSRIEVYPEVFGETLRNIVFVLYVE